MSGLGDDAAEWVGEERSAPKLQTVAFGLVAADVAALVPDAIDGYGGLTARMLDQPK